MNWYKVAQRNWDVKDEKHLRAGVGCDKVTSFRKSIAYLSKYLTKDEQYVPDENQGRYWGCSRNWGEIVLRRAELTGEQLIQFRRLVKRFLKGNERMQKLSTKPVNLIVFGHWSFFTMAIDWGKEMH